MPLISIVIAVYNGGRDLERCLSGIDVLTYPNRECILVDDASTDGMAALGAESRDVQLITLDRQNGPAFARNVGAKKARGDILFFTDADVVLHPHALSIAAEVLGRDERIAAVFGSYDDDPGHPAYLSQYRNLLHHWVHQISHGDAFSFWSGCGAVRKCVFDELGGFNSQYSAPSIEDIEFGARAKRAGHAIRLEKSMLGKHLKQWRFGTMVKTDIFRRAIPWMVLILQQGKIPAGLNLDTGSRLATVAAGLLALMLGWFFLTGQVTALLPALTLLLLTTLVSISSLPVSRGNRSGGVWVGVGLALVLPILVYGVYSNPWAMGPISLLAILVFARWGFYKFLCRKRSAAFALAALPMQFVLFLGCAFAVPLGFCKYLWVRRTTGNARVNPD